MDNITVVNLHTNPRIIPRGNGETAVKISWLQTFKNVDGNPVKYMLNLHPDRKFFFVNEDGNHERRITWEEVLTVGTKERVKEVTIIVTPEPDDMDSCMLRLDVEDSLGFFDKDKFTLIFK
ncbi:hypothetical protein [Chitinophaga sp. LS1]|uniref:hypothetical protein n=1 Tax=Chitinophaga sp. LS1 TaxID=3051176 RepID=UPI002AAB05C6|nr:hypothetical protein [Chitinophaga sp. LS1]WPV65953.1 hypothetical protein QQL36_29570 [Chitinophaga sp. LS1]